MIETPVLFLGFNRPDLAESVLSRLRDCGVRRLYVALDGPRSGNTNDTELCRSMKELIEAIDWAEEKIVLDRSENLGCGRAVSSAISWFFEHVDRGIIVEDDCLPDPTFFSFCEEMLERHADDARVWTVAGTALIPEGLVPEKPHFFSKYVGIWGWATWRRAWENYDYTLGGLSAGEWRDVVRARSSNAVEYRYWLHILDLMLEGKIDTWDFQVQFSAWKQDALHVTSSRNLVENLGFRGDATHTKGHSPLAERKSSPNPPPYEDLPLQANEALDRIVFAEKLQASTELAEWLFGESREREVVRQHTLQVEGLTSELAATLGKNEWLQQELLKEEVQLQTQAQEAEALKSELDGYYGISGALRCLGKALGLIKRSL